MEKEEIEDLLVMTLNKALEQVKTEAIDRAKKRLKKTYQTFLECLSKKNLIKIKPLKINFQGFCFIIIWLIFHLSSFNDSNISAFKRSCSLVNIPINARLVDHNNFLDPISDFFVDQYF